MESIFCAMVVLAVLTRPFVCLGLCSYQYVAIFILNVYASPARFHFVTGFCVLARASSCCAGADGDESSVTGGAKVTGNGAMVMGSVALSSESAKL